MQAISTAFGLYYHIPFCTRLCHYCDFVKTAWHEQALQERYLEALTTRTRQWLNALREEPSIFGGISSVFFGGGTPSLIDHGYGPLFESFRPFLLPDAEISLEANPEHISDAKLQIWAALGFNRISLGVQSFQLDGLRFLTREHSPDDAARAVAACTRHFPSVNIDLIYGWSGQSEERWLADIEKALSLGVQHLSLYSLTYEGRTPLARRVQRGVLEPTSDERLERFYHMARERLASAGMIHEEVSNWGLPGFLTRHNALYWQGESYLGLGSGAHSYLVGEGPWGRRWHQDAHWRRFAQELESRAMDLRELLDAPEYQIDAGRDSEAWVLETISSGLRTRRGINLDALCKRTGYILQPRTAVATALREGLMQISPQGQLTLSEAEWYRETRWALEVSLSLGPP